MKKLIALTAVALLTLGSAVTMHVVMAQAIVPRLEKANDYILPAGRQSLTKEDLALVTGIRREILKDKSLVTASNYRVVTRNGDVTLRGAVTSQLEKDTIGGIASRIANGGTVTNELVVTPGLVRAIALRGE